MTNTAPRVPERPERRTLTLPAGTKRPSRVVTYFARPTPPLGMPDYQLLAPRLELALTVGLVCAVGLVLWPELVVPVLRLMGEVGVALRDVGAAGR